MVSGALCPTDFYCLCYLQEEVQCTEVLPFERAFHALTIQYLFEFERSHHYLKELLKRTKGTVIVEEKNQTSQQKMLCMGFSGKAQIIVKCDTTGFYDSNRAS